MVMSASCPLLTLLDMSQINGKSATILPPLSTTHPLARNIHFFPVFPYTVLSRQNILCLSCKEENGHKQLVKNWRASVYDYGEEQSYPYHWWGNR